MTTPGREWSTPGCETSAGGLPELWAVIARIEEAGRARFGATFAGVELDEPGVRAIVYRVPPDARSTDAGSAAAGSTDAGSAAAGSSGGASGPAAGGGPSDVDDLVREAAAGVCVVVRDAPHGADELTALHRRITADLPFWQQRGLRITTVGARHDGTGVEVGTQDPARARTELPARYGADAPIIVVESGPVFPLGS
jgi:hypothetical protein